MAPKVFRDGAALVKQHLWPCVRNGSARGRFVSKQEREEKTNINAERNKACVFDV